MKFLKTGLLTGVAAVALAGLWGGALNGGAVSAQENRSDGSASIACVPAAGNWTDCTLTLNVGVGVGGSVAASLDNSQATLAFCDDPSQLCGITGNAAVFSCPTGCGAGTQFVLSALGAGCFTRQVLRDRKLWDDGPSQRARRASAGARWQ